MAQDGHPRFCDRLDAHVTGNSREARYFLENKFPWVSFSSLFPLCSLFSLDQRGFIIDIVHVLVIFSAYEMLK